MRGLIRQRLAGCMQEVNMAGLSGREKCPSRTWGGGVRWGGEGGKEGALRPCEWDVRGSSSEKIPQRNPPQVISRAKEISCFYAFIYLPSCFKLK